MSRKFKLGQTIVCDLDPTWGFWKVTLITEHDGIFWYDIELTTRAGHARVLHEEEAIRHWSPTSAYDFGL